MTRQVYLSPPGAPVMASFGKDRHDTSATFYAKLVAIDAMPLEPWMVIQHDPKFRSDA